MKNCEYCGSFFNGVSYKKYCSDLCRRRKRSKLESPHTNLKIVVDKKCLICNNLISKLERKDKIYCSKECKNKFRGLTKSTYSYQENVTEVGNLVLSLIKENPNTIEVNGILLEQNVYEALIELNLKLYVGDKGYAKFNYKNLDISLHRLIGFLKYQKVSTDKEPIDHINQNKLDNRSCNLRFSTNQGNAANRNLKLPSSGYRGVYKNYNGWVAQVSVNNKVKHLGRFSSPEEAAKAYDKAASEYYGEFASLNFKAS